MTEEDKKMILSMELCDFSQIQEFVKAKKENTTKTIKNNIDQRGFCEVDGVQERIGNFRLDFIVLIILIILLIILLILNPPGLSHLESFCPMGITPGLGV